MSTSTVNGDLSQKLDVRWVRKNVPGAICELGSLPLVPLPNTDRDSGRWFLGLDNKFEGTTVLLYAGKPGNGTSYRRVGFVFSRLEFLQLYERFTGAS